MHQGINKSHDIWNVKLFDIKKTDKICKGKTASSKLAIKYIFIVFSLFFFIFFTTITIKEHQWTKIADIVEFQQFKGSYIIICVQWILLIN